MRTIAARKVDIKVTVKDIKRMSPAALDQQLFDMFGVKDETDTSRIASVSFW